MPHADYATQFPSFSSDITVAATVRWFSFHLLFFSPLSSPLRFEISPSLNLPFPFFKTLMSVKRSLTDEEKEISLAKRVASDTQEPAPVPLLNDVTEPAEDDTAEKAPTPVWSKFLNARRARTIQTTPHTMKREGLYITIGSEKDVRLIMEWVYDCQSPERFPVQEDIDTVKLLRAELRAFINKPTQLDYILEAISNFDMWDTKHEGLAIFVGKLMLL